MSRVRITNVSVHPLDTGRFWGGNLDQPTEGSEHASYSLILQGWVLDRIGRPVIELFNGGELVAQAPVDRRRPDVARCYPDVPESELCGFSMVLNTLKLDPRFEVRIEVAAKNGGRVTLAVLGGDRSPLPPRPEGLSPVMVTALGRSGTSYLLLLLSLHPQILVAPPFPYEMRAGSYWLSVLDALADPESYLQQIATHRRGRLWWLGDPGFPVETYLDRDEAARFLGSESIQSTAAFCAERIHGLYEALLRRADKPEALYFAEKHAPDTPSRKWLHELFPRGREVVLVRDFRDMICSVLAFNAKRGYHGLWRELVSSDEQYISLMRGPAVELLRAWRRSGALLVKYEHLVRHPRRTLREMFTALGVDSSEGIIDQALARMADTEPDQQEAHKTSARLEDSIGRWERDLPPPLVECCQRAFGDLLAEFGYPP